jgi:hypothetical protein
MNRRRALMLAVLAAAVALAALVWIPPFVAQDRCLDGGGAWTDGRCVR